MPHTRSIQRILGAIVWIVAIIALSSSLFRVYARTSRPVVRLNLHVPDSTSTRPGDIVYLSTDKGLEAVGEVAAIPEPGKIALEIRATAFGQLRESTTAVCWRTPMSTAHTLDALFPPMIQRAAAEKVVSDWQLQDERLAAAWGPLIVDLSASYLRLISEDIESALRSREERLWYITEWHGRSLAEIWPGVQEQLNPIMQEHLTPVLGRLMSEAISDAPKMSIGYNLARGRNEQAYQLMLDWLTDYLARIPEKDRKELNAAILTTWEKARDNPRIVEPLRKIGRDVLEDQRLREVLTDVYRQAITENPKTADFLRSQVMESKEVRDKFYALVDAFAPTAKHLAALCLFDESGTTRPEIVHLVRSVALRRQMSWVTLMVNDPNSPPISPDATIVAATAGGDG